MKVRHIQDSVVYRMGMLRGALLERIKSADTCLGTLDRVESLACKGARHEDVEAALGEVEALAGVNERKDEGKQ